MLPMRTFMLLALLLSMTGCGLLPEISHEPVIRNPFPQLSRVGVAPFINLSDEATVDTREFAIAYFNELQATPGFEVVPLAVVETTIRQHGIRLEHPSEARRLAQLLGVDAVVIGAVTEYTPYYPPRCGLQVQWFAANPCFHAIPAGYGLPWGTSEEEYIPEPLVYESEMALARAQLDTQSPAYEPDNSAPPTEQNLKLVPPPSEQQSGIRTISHDEPCLRGKCAGSAQAAITGPIDMTGALGPNGKGLPADWPDGKGLIPDGPQATPPACVPTDRPVLSHTRIYHGNDSEFTAALANYEYHRDDARMGGWQGYLWRHDDFIRFCCYVHITEMLTARGGGGKSRVVWRWRTDR
jgi:hypothetical protein